MQQIASLTPDDLQRIKGIKTSATAIHTHARAFVENRPIWFGALPVECCPVGYMFDLETDPYTQAPWSWGWCDLDGTPHMTIVAAHHTESEVKLPWSRGFCRSASR